MTAQNDIKTRDSGSQWLLYPQGVMGIKSQSLQCVGRLSVRNTKWRQWKRTAGNITQVQSNSPNTEVICSRKNCILSAGHKISHTLNCRYVYKLYRWREIYAQWNSVITSSVYATPRIYSVRYSVVPSNSSLLTITLHYSVITTLVYNDTKYPAPFMTL
jgi:hypothetical protein